MSPSWRRTGWKWTSWRRARRSCRKSARERIGSKASRTRRGEREGQSSIPVADEQRQVVPLRPDANLPFDAAGAEHALDQIAELRGAQELDAVAGQEAVAEPRRRVWQARYPLPFLDDDAAAGPQDAPDTLQERRALGRRHVVKNVGEHHHVVCGRRRFGDLLDGGLPEDHARRIAPVEAADPVRDVDAGDRALGKTLRDLFGQRALAAAHFQDGLRRAAGANLLGEPRQIDEVATVQAPERHLQRSKGGADAWAERQSDLYARISAAPQWKPEPRPTKQTRLP